MALRTQILQIPSDLPAASRDKRMKKGQPKQTETKAQAKIDNGGKMKKGSRAMRHPDKGRTEERGQTPMWLQGHASSPTGVSLPL